jgi:hypothetical protein
VHAAGQSDGVVAVGRPWSSRVSVLGQIRNTAASE